MLSLINNCTINEEENEDLFFSGNSSTTCSDFMTINKPDYTTAKFFSMETVPSQFSFGLHNTWKYGNYPNYCDNFDMLILANDFVSQTSGS